MMSRLFLCALLLLAQLSQPHAQPSSFPGSLQFGGGAALPPVGVKWSDLNVKADSNGTPGNGTDNAAALNALPANTVIIGDCPLGGGVRIGSQWFWKSNLTVLVQQGCRVYCDWVGSVGSGCISQSNFNVALTNIKVTGLYFKNLNPLTFKGKSLRAWIEGFTYTGMTADSFFAFFYGRGCDQEWNFSFINSPSVGDVSNPGDGLRHLGNEPKCPTTGGKPANVWVHDSFTSGQSDGALQIAPVCGDLWGNLSSDDFLYENSTVSGFPGTMLLIGFGTTTGGCTNTSITNVIMRNITGSSSGQAIAVYNAVCPSCLISDVLIQNVTVDNSPRTTQSLASAAAVTIAAFDFSPVRNVTFQNVTVNNVYSACFGAGGEPMTGVVVDTLFCSNQRATAYPNVGIRATTGITIRNSTIGTRVGGGILLGPNSTTNPLLNRLNGGVFTVTAPILQNNTVFDIANVRTGILMQNVTGASVTGGTFNPKAGNNTAVGLRLTAAVSPYPGTTTSTVTGNVFHTGTGIVCAPSLQNNIVTGNSGANPCP